MIQFDQYIQYGNAKHGEEFQRLLLKVKEISLISSLLVKVLFNETLITTSIFRKKTTDSGIHEAFRAIDFKPLSKPEYTYKLIEMINQVWIYDPLRPKIKVAHENPFHGTGAHIHIQAHLNTVCLTPERTEYFKMLAKNDETNFKPQVLV